MQNVTFFAAVSEPLLEALVQILNQILEDLHLPTVDPEAVTFPELGVEGDRVKRDLFSGVTGLPPSPLVVIIELLNKILETLNLPTVNPEAVTIPSDAGRVKRDAFEPVTAEPTFDVLLDILNQILECLHLPTINPEEVTVPSEEGGRAKRDIPFGITLPSENPLAELIAKLLEIIAKLESFEFGTGAPLPILESLNLPTVNPEAVTIPSDAGRVKRDAFEPVTAEPTFDVLLDILNQILECLHLPTINPEEVTVPSEEGGRAKRDIPFGITLPSENPLAELIAKLLEIIAKLESFEFGTGAPLPVTFPSFSEFEALQFGNDLQELGDQFSEGVFGRKGDSEGNISLGTAALFRRDGHFLRVDGGQVQTFQNLVQDVEQHVECGLSGDWLEGISLDTACIRRDGDGFGVDDRVKRDIFSGVTGLPPSPLVVIIELLNKILESLNLPTVNPEAVTIPSDAGRVKRDAFEPVTAEPTFDVLLDILNQILECLHLPTINPEEVTVPSEEGGRAKRDIPFGITLPSENPLAELIAKLLEIIAKLESFEFGTGAPLPVTFPSL
uniref:Flg_hook domain-containing protein n=1 Tax=Bursaphelenchus xylophilus TaxID=6326 RepID=A0A1I7RZR3_BURXY